MRLSISNSKLRAPELNYRNSFVGSLLVFFCLSTVLVMTNAYLDPFHLGDWGPKADIDRVKAFRRQNTALWHVAGLERVLKEIPESTEAEVLIVGDSRARAMTGSWRLDSNIYAVDSKGRGIINLAYGGPNLSESIDMYYFYKDRFPRVKTIVLSADFEKLSNKIHSGPGRAKLDEALRTARNPILYYLNFRTLNYYLETRALGDISPSRGQNSETIDRITLPNPERFSVPKGYDEAKSLEAIFEKDIWLKIANNMKRKIMGASVEALNINLNTQIKPMMVDSPNAQFVFVTLPIHPHFEKMIDLKKQEVHSEMNKELSKLGTVYDALLYDGGETLFEIEDPQHVIGAATTILQDALDCHETSNNFDSLIAYSKYNPCLAKSENEH